VAVGRYYIFSSSNGKEWVQRVFHINGSERKGVAFGAGRFVNVGVGGFAEVSGSIGMLGASLSPDGRFIGTLSGMSGQKYSTQSSGRLEDWTTFTNLTLTNGTGQCVDSSTNGSNRFYKALPVNK
jgi:hypothetical protein